MRAFLAALSRALAVVSRIALWAAGAGLVLMSRFILLGSAVGVRESNHLGFEVGLHHAPPALRHAMLAVTELLVIGFGLAMAWYGYDLVAETWSAAMPGLPIPQGMDYVPLCVGGGLIALFACEKLVLLLKGDEAALIGAREPHLV